MRVLPVKIKRAMLCTGFPTKFVEENGQDFAREFEELTMKAQG